MKLFLINVFLWLPFWGRSQTPVQVVTKVIEKDLPYTEGQMIRLNAQKADVTIKGWNRPTISIKLRLVAKHPDRAVAEREVAYHQYTLQLDNGQIELSNRFVIPQRAGKLQSQLKAIYEVSLPNKALMTLTNSFGDIHLSNFAGNVSVNFEFGKLSLDDIGGKLTIASNYGDIEGYNLNASLSLKAEKADVVLRELGGTANLQNQYGRLTTEVSSTLSSMTIEAARTEILLIAKRLSDFRFDISISYGDIRLPQELANQLARQGSRQMLKYQPFSRKPEVIIRNSYSTILIQNDKSLVDR